MTDHDRRGAYTPPTDEPLHFDARRPRSGGGTPPTTLLVSAVILLVLVGGAFVYYRSGIRHDGQAPAVVGAPVGGKAQAPESDQPQDPAAGLQVYNSETPQTAAPAPAPTLAPAPEEPLPRIAGPAASAPDTELPAAPARTAEAKAPARAPKPLPVKPLAPAKAEEVASAAPPAKLPAKAPAAAAPAKVASAIGAAAVQIGAFSSNAQADKGWNDAARASPAKMLGKGKKVETVDRDGHTLYRTFVTGFASRDDAAAFCEDLKAAGKPCIVR